MTRDETREKGAKESGSISEDNVMTYLASKLTKAEQELQRRVRPRETDSAKVIQVIETKSVRGKGTEEDVVREVVQYWDFDGNMLAESDPCAPLPDRWCKRCGKRVKANDENRYICQCGFNVLV